MSVTCQARVWDKSGMKGSPLLLLLALADFADDNGFCWPGIDTLAQKIRMSERQTKRLLEKLETAGELAVLHRRNRGNVYIVMLGLSEAQFKKADKRVVAFTGRSLSANLSLIQQVELSDIPGTTEDTQGKMSDMEGKISDTAMSLDPSRSVIDPSRDPSITVPVETETSEQRRSRLQEKFGSDPLEGMTLAAARGAGDASSFTVPAIAGGADAFTDGPLTVWCELIGRNRLRLQDSEVIAWAKELGRIADLRGATANELAWALRQWQRAIVAQIHAKKGQRIQIPGNIAWRAPTGDTLFAHKNDPNRGMSAFLAPLIEYGMDHGLDDLTFEEVTIAESEEHRDEPPPRMDI